MPTNRNCQPRQEWGSGFQVRDAYPGNSSSFRLVGLVPRAQRRIVRVHRPRRHAGHVRTIVGVATEQLGLLVHHHVKSDAIAIPQTVHFESDVIIFLLPAFSRAGTSAEWSREERAVLSKKLRGYQASRRRAFSGGPP